MRPRLGKSLSGPSVGEEIDALRSAVGQEAIETDSMSADDSYFGRQPEWFQSRRRSRVNRDRLVNPLSQQ